MAVQNVLLQKRPDLFILIVAVSFATSLFTPLSVYAQEGTGFEEPITGFFDWINDIFSESIDDTNLNNDTTTNLQSTLDAGTDAGKKGVGLWFGIHHFFVEAIFAGTSEADLPISKDMITIISMIAVFIIIISLLRHLFKENMKIFVIVIVVLLILASVGIFIEF